MNSANKTLFGVLFILCCVLMLFVIGRYAEHTRPQSTVQLGVGCCWVQGNSAETVDCISNPTGQTAPNARTRFALGFKLDVNDAQQEDLERVPGIGPKLANRIVQARATQGNFTSIEDFHAIVGLPKKLRESTARFLTVASPTCHSAVFGNREGQRK